MKYQKDFQPKVGDLLRTPAVWSDPLCAEICTVIEYIGQSEFHQPKFLVMTPTGEVKLFDHLRWSCCEFVQRSSTCS